VDKASHADEVKVNGDEPEEETESDAKTEEGAEGEDELQAATDDQQKEIAVWDSFKEEHHEVLEQLPLSIHRQYTLLKELDDQAQAYSRQLLSTTREYVDLRKRLALLIANTRPTDDNTHPEITVNNEPHHNVPSFEGPSPLVNGDQTDSHEGIGKDAPNGQQLENSPPMRSKSAEDPLGASSRSLLQRIANLDEESLRTADEKVNIAQTIQETVERYIRLVEQEIKEQEVSISLGMRPGTHIAPILLPDLVVPRWVRHPRAEQSPVPLLLHEDDSGAVVVDEPDDIEPLKEDQQSKKSKKGKKGPFKKEESTSERSEVPPNKKKPRATIRLTIPVPPLHSQEDSDIWCYCQKPSGSGVMVACDNENCPYEWFHLDCTDLTKAPEEKDKWFCRECEPKVSRSGRVITVRTR